MSQYKIFNDKMELLIDSHGAELRSLRTSGIEYMWQADAAYWARTSPVLFPFVGGLRNKEYRYEGTTYSMTQHGFARDMEFQLKEQSADSITFVLQDNEVSREKYPFRFLLEIKYTLLDSGVEVAWRVLNTGAEELLFSIGAHPAFNCPFHIDEKQSDYSFVLRKQGKELTQFRNTLLTPQGLASRKQGIISLNNGTLPIAENLFDGDALVIEHYQADEVAILDASGKEYVRVSFDMPLFGLWSPPKKNAPFVCIEPWCGRCDAEDFEGELAEREYSQSLESGAEFRTSYKIMVQ